MAGKRTDRLTRKMIDDALRARGRDESLYPGEGYFFFGGGDAVHWLSSSVMVNRISDLSFLEQWLVKFDELLERDQKLRKQMVSVGESKSSAKPKPAGARAQGKTR